MKKILFKKLWDLRNASFIILTTVFVMFIYLNIDFVGHYFGGFGWWCPFVLVTAVNILIAFVFAVYVVPQMYELWFKGWKVATEDKKEKKVLKISPSF